MTRERTYWKRDPRYFTTGEAVWTGARLGNRPDHDHLSAIVIRLPNDYYGYLDREQAINEGWGSDCSSGCRWYLPVRGELGMDWGVCSNPRSHRCGLLTFEHQGCPQFEDKG